MNRYTIAQVARLVGRTPKTLRRWEASGRILHSSKIDPTTKARIYTDADVAAIKATIPDEIDNPRRVSSSVHGQTDVS